MKKNLFTSAAVMVLSLSTLSACGGVDMYAPDTLTHEKLEVHEKSFTQDVAVGDVDRGYLNWLAQHYMKHGDDQAMDLVVTFDPRSYSNTAMKAKTKANEIVATLNELGVHDVQVTVLPIQDQGDVSHMLVQYNSYYAKAPAGCDESMPGLDGKGIEYNADYKIGCGVETMVAKQVARPADLLGRGAQPGETLDGRAATNIVDGYRTGAQNTALDGESASASN